LSEEFEGVHG